MGQRDVIDKLRLAMFAAYADLQNKNPDAAKNSLIVGLEGGSVANPLDFVRCLDTWNAKVKKAD